MYRTIVADPPWEINRTLGVGGRRKNATTVPYKFMSVDAICALPVADVILEDARLFLWSTRKVFREGWAVRVARAWGFEPVGEFIWGLRNPGTGSRALANDHEPCLIAERGHIEPLDADEACGVFFWRQVYEWNPKAKVPQKKHSAKPTGFIERVEQISPGPYVELFAREARLGWDTWGDEALNHVELTA
ncbi:MAG: MT-A70 family methyltransferase [Sulfuricaulis sp.]